MNMVTFLPAAALAALTPGYSGARRLTAGAIALMMLATVVLTRSRGGALGLVLMLGALVMLAGKIRSGIGAAAVAVVLIGLPFLPTEFWARMASIVDANQDQREFTGSREARRIVMLEGLNTFLARPLTGVGAGQFKNFNPPERRERFRETHNALLQVAAETGILGLVAFSFLILRAATAAAAARRMLAPVRGRAPDPLKILLDDGDRKLLYSHTVAMTAGLVGWFVCSLFASVAYSWTFYYLLALTVSARELTRDRLRTAQTIEADRARPVSVRSLRLRRAATGAA
jgi:O-antigen ligase